jgi:diguanylate cyclase (GGDEF)-like protein
MGELLVNFGTDHSSNKNAAHSASILVRLTILVALAQVGILLRQHHSGASNLLQVVASTLSVLTCMLQAAQSRTRKDQRAWWELAGGFFLWTLAQGIYTTQILLQHVPSSPSLTDALWLTFAFPILIVAARPLTDSRKDPIGWIDTFQASLLFSILIALVFRRPSGLSLAIAYDVQSLAMLLTVAPRFSTTRMGPERRFFRNLFCFCLLYACFSVLGYLGPFHHFLPGGIIDLCWSIPFLGFNLLTLVGRDPHEERVAPLPSTPSLLSLSALGLAAMSLLAAGVLAHRNPWIGGLCTTLACLLFALRIYLREGQLRTAQLRLEYSANYDMLTGLANRAFIHREMEQQLSTATTDAPETGAVLFLDLDRFKTLNDGLGHSFGDSALFQMAQRIRRVVGTSGVVGRYGGDEFVIVLHATTPQGTARVASALLQAIREPFFLDGRALYLTGSMGIVMMEPGDSPADLLQDADCAMYRAKNLGKDRFEFFTPSMRSAVEQRLQLEADLHAALATQSLEVHYQPIYSLPDCTITGFEALVRWNHPERGMISPADFIPLAEETALIQPLGKLVLRDACFRLQAWNAAYHARLTVNVNVSARQFDDPGLLDIIIEALGDAGLAPNLLKLEITESALLTANASVQTVLAGARALGIEICLDDFGTGYSSLSYLLEYPFDIVKIDQSFVRNMHHDPARAELVRTVIELSTNLNKRVIAEGVESNEEIAWLSSLRCQMLQGYLLSRPLTPTMVDELLESIWPHKGLAMRALSQKNASASPRSGHVAGQVAPSTNTSSREPGHSSGESAQALHL